MRKFLENVLGGFASLLGFYFIMTFLLSGWAQGQLFYWILTAAVCAGVLILALMHASQPADRKEPAFYFFLSVIAVFAIALLVSSPHWNELGNFGAVALWASVIGVPLGIGASESLKGQLYAAGGRDIAVGVVMGIVGAIAALLVLDSMYQRSGMRLYVPFLDILTFNPLGVNFFPPEIDTLTELACTRGTGPCPPGQSFRGLQWIAGFVVQGGQSSVAALWDAILFGGVVYAVTAAGRAVLGMRN